MLTKTETQTKTQNQTTPFRNRIQFVERLEKMIDTLCVNTADKYGFADPIRQYSVNAPPDLCFMSYVEI